MSTVAFDPATGDLRAPAAVMAWLLEGEDDEPPAELADSAAMADGELHPVLAAARTLVATAPVHVLLERGERRGRGWLGPGAAALGHPLPGGGERLVVLAPALLIEALVLLNDVGPRPGAAYDRFTAQPGELAMALAARDPSALVTIDPAAREAARALLGGLREHWRLATRWRPATEATVGARELEVLDSDAGYWLVVPDDPTVELWPARPTDVYRSICRLFPPMREVAGWPTS